MPKQHDSTSVNRQGDGGRACRWCCRFVALFTVILGALFIALPGRAQSGSIDGSDPANIVDALDVTLLTEEYPPFNFLENGQLRGVGAEVVQAMAGQIGYGRHIEVLPWKRVILRLEEDANIGVFSMTRTPQREDMYSWVGPIVRTNAGIYQLVDQPNPVRSIDDLRSAKGIGVQAGGADEVALRSYGFDNLEPIHNPRGGVLMLASGRIALLVSSDIELFRQIGDTSVTRDQLQMVYGFASADLYLAFSKQTPPSVVKVWQKAYDRIVESGQFDRILAQYGVSTNQHPLFEGSLAPGQ
ncbi:substrate-binding periplasmic protein [Thalassospira lohafexi]|uniref:Solute-binding protein family 3/N-terminal domain-containing protein n=1 Tax=Thalassospira lohafexi TaxID=744227 RepID=A0A2N3L1Y6_9PROT|nr:ABC transporter substrate-binding protein [Thalassospira lohafexi]PKR56815.1 hypothetical protein COO92_19415 [Thalassospira lohafexi]